MFYSLISLASSLLFQFRVLGWQLPLKGAIWDVWAVGGGVFWKPGPEREGISQNAFVESLKPEEGVSGMEPRSALGTGLPAALEAGCESRMKARRNGQWSRVG